MPSAAWTVQTGRLRLSPVGWQDLAGLAAIKADPAIFAQMLGGVRNRAQIADELAGDIAFWSTHRVGMWTVREIGQLAVIGLTGIHERPDGRGFGLRFAFLPVARGRGVAREAAGAALRYAHDVAEVPRVVAVTREANFDSRTVLGAIGMRPVEQFLRHGEQMMTFASERRPQ